MFLRSGSLPSALVLLASVTLAGCNADSVCDLIGSYTGTFSGDAEGNLDIAITDGTEGADPIVTVTLSGDAFSAVGDGTVNCEDGELTITLLDDTGAEVGTFDGSMVDLGGTWEVTEGDMAGASGDWSVE
jgi:hypothetical protein